MWWVPRMSGPLLQEFQEGPPGSATQGAAWHRALWPDSHLLLFLFWALWTAEEGRTDSQRGDRKSPRDTEEPRSAQLHVDLAGLGHLSG